MFCGALHVTVHLPQAGSLKAKRSVVKHLVESARARYGVAAAEVGAHDRWQLAELGFSCVASTPGHVTEVLDTVERYVWSHPEVEVTGTERGWAEVE